MKKTALLIIALFAVTAIAFAQDQTINGNLSVKGLLYLPDATDQDNKSPGLTGWPNDDFLFKGKYLNHYGLGFYTTDSELRAYLSDYFGIDFFTEGKQRLTIARNGNVGIGTENPTEKLDVDGDVIIGRHTKVWSGYGKRLTLSGVGDDTDDMWLSKYCWKGNKTDLRVNIGDDPEGIPGNMDRFIIGTTTPYNSTNWLSHFTVESGGNVGIGTENPQTKLDVAGTIRAKEVKIEATGWADFVFDKNYDLPKLSDVEKHINDKQHLPGIPSEKEVLENGVNVVDMQAKLLQKIEELTLYVIEQDKKIEKQDNQNKNLQQQVNELKAQLNERQP